MKALPPGWRFFLFITSFVTVWLFVPNAELIPLQLFYF